MSHRKHKADKYSQLLKTDMFDKQLYTYLIHYLYKSGFISVSLTLGILVGFYFLLIDKAGISVLNFKLWCATMICVSAVRLINTLDYFKSPLIRENATTRELYFSVTAFLNGTSWFYFLVFVLNGVVLSTNEYYMIIIIISALIAGSVNTLAPSPKSFALFCTPMILGITYNFLFIQQIMYMTFIMSGLFICLIAIYINSYHILKENIVARLLNEVMLKELEKHNSSLVSEILEKSKQAHLNWEMAHKDSLTGLDNRRSLEMQITLLQNKVEGMSNNALVFIDLDDFKTVNDTLGHNIGDKLLIEVGKRLKGNVKQHDLVVRQGGDEFILLLSNIKNEDIANKVAQRILKRISELYNIEQYAINITASIGVYLFDMNNKSSAESLLENADKALYTVKHSSKNNICIQR